MTGAAIAGICMIAFSVGWLVGAWWRGVVAMNRAAEEARLREHMAGQWPLQRSPDLHIWRPDAEWAEAWAPLDRPFDWQDDPNLADPHNRDGSVGTGW